MMKTIRQALSRIAAAGLFLGLTLMFGAQSSVAQQPGPETVVFAGLRSFAHEGQFNAVATDAAGNLYLLLDQKDGIRLIKTDAGATTVLAQAALGASGDIGLAMALDPSGNVYVTGTSTSGALTGTAGAAFVNPVDTTANSFVAKFDSSLNLKFATFGGSGRAAASAITATADAVFITGLIYGNGLPVTPAGIIQKPAEGSAQNGFVEKFSASGSTLLYATYLSGAAGDTSPTVIVADAHDDAYIGGFTTAPGFPTIAALIPRAVAVTSGFLLELTPAGDGITFSTYIPGSGISAIAMDPASNTLLLSGTISLGQFPVATVAAPLVNTPYQVLLRMPLDGSSVLSSTVLAPGTQSFLTPAPNGAVWVDGTMSTPLLPLPAVSNIGNGFALRVTPQGTAGQTVVDEAVRFGGLAPSNPNYASVQMNLTSLAVDSTGSALIAGGAAPTASSILLATQTFDLPLTNTPTPALPSAIHDAVLDPASCTGSLCAGSGAYLARITPVAGASLALSTDASPSITLRNLGSAQAAGLQIAVTSFTEVDTCGTTLNAGAECTIVLSGTGPGTLTISASNAITQTTQLGAVPSGTTPQTLVFSPKELDFGVQTSTSPALTRTITITNLGPNTATFTSALNGRLGFTPFTFAEASSDCSVSGAISNKQLAPGATCHIALSFTASSNAAKDGPAQANWMIGSSNVLLTGYAQAASLSLSASEVDFGTQFFGGLSSPRFLYLSNSSSAALAHTAVALPSGSPFTITDRCPAQLNPQTVCQIQLGYLSPVSTSTDATTLALDQSLSVQVTGQTIPQPGTTGSTAPPSLSVSPTTLAFPTAVVVSGVSASTQTVVIQNTGTSSFSLSLSLTGDFTDQTNCVATLAAGASCNVVLTFAPSQPGSRQGLLGVTAGSGTSPGYVALSGTGTAILPANNGTLDFGSIPINQPTAQWYKVSQPFSTLTAATLSSMFKVLLVEDIGYGHGQPPASAFLSATTGSCLNCWLGVQFTALAVGAQTGTLSLMSALTGNPYILALTGTGLTPLGMVLSPSSANFGPIAVSSSSAPQTFTLTNLTGMTAVSIGTLSVTGDFSVSSTQSTGTSCSSTLAQNASCVIPVVFAPTAIGQRAGTLTLQTGSGTVTAALTGSGSPDPSVAFNPSALVFNNVPGPTASQQSVTVSNTGTGTLQIGIPSTSTSAFQANSACTTLAIAATCTIAVTYVPGVAIATDTLQVPVTGTVGGSPVTITYPLALSGTYTAAAAGLQITPNTSNIGPFAVDAVGGTRQFTVSNLTNKSLAVNVALPRQFLLQGTPCTALASGGTCNFSTTFVPVTAGDITGTLSVQGTPTDGSSAVNGIGYVEGYGTATNTLAVSGDLSPGSLLNFGQVASGQSLQQVVTLTNTSTTGSITVRRVTSRWPFLSTTTCGTTLSPAQSCTVTIAYTPLNQVASGAPTPPATSDAGTLTIESDSVSSPDIVNLAGTGNPISNAAPANTAPVSSFTASQSSLTFAPTAVGFSSAPQTVTLTNTGTSLLHVSGLAASSDFSVSGGCGAVLPGTTCVLTVAFVPQVSSLTAGPRIGTVEIASDSSTSLEFLSLLGAANAPALLLQPTALAFGPKLIGTTSTLPVQITNSSSIPVTFNGITATGDYTTSGSCPAKGSTLAASASCTVQVAFTPSVAGTRNGTLNVPSSASDLPLTASLTGTGAQSHLQLSPASLNFGSVTQGTTASLSLTLANNGTTSITGLAFTATGDYAVTAPCAVTTLAAGASCSVTIAFTPIASGPRSGTLTVASSDPASPNTVALTGNGVAPSPPPPTPGSFTLSATASSASVAQSYPATYTLTVTPQNGFTGQVVLNCAPVIAALYASCSLQPSSVTLSGAAQTVSVTINTVTTALNTAPSGRRVDGVTLCLLLPAAFLFWHFRKALPKQRWSLLLALVCTSFVLLVSGCGSSGTATSNLRTTPVGSYQYAVSANSTTGTVVSQSVTLSLVVQ